MGVGHDIKRNKDKNVPNVAQRRGNSEHVQMQMVSLEESRPCPAHESDAEKQGRPCLFDFYHLFRT